MAVEAKAATSTIRAESFIRLPPVSGTVDPYGNESFPQARNRITAGKAGSIVKVEQPGSGNATGLKAEAHDRRHFGWGRALTNEQPEAHPAVCQRDVFRPRASRAGRLPRQKWSPYPGSDYGS